jgi:2,3-bisphosphoglycerate-dependent phosphoglycerate mutase
LTTIYFVRHAHSSYTPDELKRPLSPAGLSDAEQVTKILQNEPINVAISSPYKRAVQTIAGISEHFNIPIREEVELRERLLSAYPLEDFEIAVRTVWEDPSFSWPGGESNKEAQRRGVNCLLHLLEQYEGKSIVIGTHGNIMALIMQHFDPKYDFAFWQSLSMPDIYKLVFSQHTLLSVERLWEVKNNEVSLAWSLRT